MTLCCRVSKRDPAGQATVKTPLLYNWAQHNDVLRAVAWLRVQIRVDLNPFRRAEAG